MGGGLLRRERFYSCGVEYGELLSVCADGGSRLHLRLTNKRLLPATGDEWAARLSPIFLKRRLTRST